ncbi:MAG: sigma 54-interacting transcriptional regulator, partial [Bradymonadaceae bacterium]
MRLLVLAEDDPVSLLMKGLRERDNIELRRVSSHLDALSMAQTWHPHVVIITESLASPELVSSIRDHAPVPSYLLIKEYSPAGLTQVVRCGASSAITSETSPEDFLRLLHLDLEAWQPDSVHALSQLGSIEFVGESAVIKEVCRLIAFSAPSNASVLITGESGTGKEVVAQAIHRLSPRRDAPFVAINCCAIPENLLEAELFGHEKGAFTGAEARRQGRFELADGGTLFLDEIGEIDTSTQVKLLRFLEQRTFERLGSLKPVKVDLRLVAATNRNLEEMVRKGTFREDLFYRLNVVRLFTPPLRERSE